LIAPEGMEGGVKGFHCGVNEAGKVVEQRFFSVPFSPRRRLTLIPSSR